MVRLKAPAIAYGTMLLKAPEKELLTEPETELWMEPEKDPSKVLLMELSKEPETEPGTEPLKVPWAGQQ